uniref:Uncharacterized protein n=1 Tax=Meloidogyne enterolobii TaxID=390850 RepID=A0A6V7V422_MELEN|nr:unnamed protein product [Meloidogyne enterolobii]
MFEAFFQACLHWMDRKSLSGLIFIVRVIFESDILCSSRSFGPNRSILTTLLLKNDSYLKSHGKPSKVIINLDYCEEILTLLDDIVNIFNDVIKDVTNKLEGKNKVKFIYNCHLKENGDNSDNFIIAHIPIMQEELSK